MLLCGFPFGACRSTPFNMTRSILPFHLPCLLHMHMIAHALWSRIDNVDRLSCWLLLSHSLKFECHVTFVIKIFFHVFSLFMKRREHDPFLFFLVWHIVRSLNLIFQLNKPSANEDDLSTIVISCASASTSTCRSTKCFATFSLSAHKLPHN